MVSKIAIGLVTLSILLPCAAQAQFGYCRVANATSSGLIFQLKAMMAATDPDEVFARDSIYKVPVVDTSSIQLVTSEIVCRQASYAYNAEAVPYDPGLTLDDRVFVIALGNSYVAVLNPWFDTSHRTVLIFRRGMLYRRVGGWTGN